ncbi:MAG: STAS domain-containing protein [Pyrinomonadaceae bacterium]
MRNLNIDERLKDDVMILDLSGDITIGENSRILREEIRKLLGQGQKRILLNMDEVAYVDSSGLGEIVSDFGAVSRDGGELKLLNLTEHFQDIITITKLLTVFDCFENEDEAVRSFW